MKKVLFFLFACFLILINFDISAQTYHPFPTDSAQWSIRHTQNSPFAQNSWQLKMKGDTLLNGLVYHKIYYSLILNYSSPNETLHCFVREDTTKKVFVKYPVNSGYDTTEFMLYNFNLSVGDIVTVRLLNYTTDSIFNLVVTNIDSSLFLTGYRKFIGLAAMSQMWGGSCDNIISWTEEIGCNYGLLYDEMPEMYCGNGDKNWLVCYEKNNVYLFGGSNCDYFYDGINDASNQLILLTLSPNPFNTSTQITLDKTYHNISLSIYDIQGKLMLQKQYADCNQIQLNRNGLNNGMYFIKLTLDDRWVETGKIVVSE